jgi:4-hydroxy-3-polyprenylbenzoate decarboxylase
MTVMQDKIPTNPAGVWSRRELLGTSLGLAALGSSPPANAVDFGFAKKSQAPFSSMRDYIAALDKAGLVVRIPKLDQDAYEATALMYRFRDQHGMNGSPTLLIEKIRVNGEWLQGPLIINESGHLDSECIAFGLEPEASSTIRQESFASYRKARAFHEATVAKNGGEFPSIEPLKVTSADAPCKEIILTGAEIDLTRFPFIQCNPSDAGRYINTGVVFTHDEKRGTNFGTYRCHLRGPREIGLNSEPGQTGFRQLEYMRLRGAKVAKVSIVLSPDPYVWIVSGNRIANRFKGPVDELALAGGMAGRALQIVKSETNEHWIPANAELVIEGEVPLDDKRPEGPYGEMYGYQGKVKTQQYWMRVTAVTHRKNPWIMNNFTGLQRGTLMAPGHALSFYKLKQKIPAVVDYFGDNRAVGMTFVSINKTRPGEGLEVAKQITEGNFFAKIVVVVDADLDVTNQEQMLAALGARWQPDGATHIYKRLPGMPLDPSAVKRGQTNKIAIDATRQWPEENGPAVFPPMNRSLLEEGAPQAFAQVDEKWGKLIREWAS